jgi:Flp pilus assembly protein TadG
MLTKFWNNAHGGVAPLLALTIVPLLWAVGIAIDYSRINAAHAAFQNALDSTALMLAKTAANETSTRNHS